MSACRFAAESGCEGCLNASRLLVTLFNLWNYPPTPPPQSCLWFSLHLSCFFFSLSTSFCLTAPLSHVNLVHTPLSPPPPFSVCPPRCVALPSLAILCVLIKNATLFTFHFFWCVPSRARGSHWLSCITAIWRPSRKAPHAMEKMCCTRFSYAVACHWYTAFLLACENVLSLFFFLQ